MVDSRTQTRLADDPQMPRLGTIVGQRYEVQRVLGEGGFAVVYGAYDARTKAEVAVKILDPIMSRRTEFASRFMREVETVSRLRHHNTISVFDAGETANGCLYLVMELLDGKPLDVVLEEEGRLGPDRVRAIAIQILKSLQEAHSKGIIHRDLKPANVFLADIAGETDYVKVLDFGIAKSLDDSQENSLTATGQVMCSPHYVAPERVKEHVTLPASDLYSLGVMMIELLEGTPPYQADTPMMLAVKHLAAEPVPMGETTRAAEYAWVIERACSKPLDVRYDSAIEMLDDLVEGVRPGGAMPASPTEQTPKSAATSTLDTSGRTGGIKPHPRGRRRLVVGIVGGFGLLGAVLALAIVRLGAVDRTDGVTIETMEAPELPRSAGSEPVAAIVEPAAGLAPEETGPAFENVTAAAVTDAAGRVDQAVLVGSSLANAAAASAAAEAESDGVPEPRSGTGRARERARESHERDDGADVLRAAADRDPTVSDSAPETDQPGSTPRSDVEPVPPSAGPTPDRAAVAEGEPEPSEDDVPATDGEVPTEPAEDAAGADGGEPRRNIRTNVAPIQ